MKKYISLSLIFCLLLTLCTLTGCSSKTPQTVAGFTEFMEDAGFQVKDVTASTVTNDLATAVIVADNGKYQLEFWELTDNETGSGVFNHNKSRLENLHSAKTLSLELTFNNYNYYSYTSGGDYHMIARIDNTMLYCIADAEHSDEIVDLVKELGYK